MKTLPLFLFLAACVSPGPSAADVQADRDRWTAVRDVTADAQVDTQEAPLISQLLVAWDHKLTADEAAAGKARTTQTILADILRVYGGASVQMFLVPQLQARAPLLFKYADTDSNGSLSPDELLRIDPTDPVFALVVLDTARQLLERRR